jgi:hypothetical protein
MTVGRASAVETERNVRSPSALPQVTLLRCCPLEGLQSLALRPSVQTAVFQEDKGGRAALRRRRPQALLAHQADLAVGIREATHLDLVARRTPLLCASHGVLARFLEVYEVAKRRKREAACGASPAFAGMRACEGGIGTAETPPVGDIAIRRRVMKHIAAAGDAIFHDEYEPAA